MTQSLRRFARTLVLCIPAALCTGVALAQTAAAPVPPPAWQQGRNADMASSPLAPLAAKLTVTSPADIPLDRLKLPPGFKIELWAHGMPGARQMARGASGKIYIGTRAIGRVYELTDNGGARTSRVVVDKLNQPAGVAIRDGRLYVMAIGKALRFDGIESNPTVTAKDITADFNFPKLEHHQWKYISFGPDGKLYVPFGAPCNICDPSHEYAQIRRYNADGSGMEVLARGVRNTVGFDWHPDTKELWFSDHGRDWMGDDTPEDELNRMSANGQHFGYPTCHANGVVDPDIKKDDPCGGVTLPVTTMGAHTAVMGVHFYTGSQFPTSYKNALFVARKGSWNRTKKSGFDIVRVHTTADGKNARIEPFLTGFMNPADDSFWGRPAYILQMPDGSMLVSDEQVGAIYRITYAG